MKSKTLISSLLVAALVGLAFSSSQAQESRRGTAGATELLVPVGARTAGLSSSLTSGLEGVNPLEGLTSNPANVISSLGTNAMFSRTEYVADIGINYFGIQQGIGNNAIALSVNSWDFGDIPLTTVAEPEVGDLTYAASDIVVGLSYGRVLTDRIAAGVTVKGISERIDDVSASGVAFDVGMTYIAGESGLRFGVSLLNFGPKMQYGGTGLVNFARLPTQQDDAKRNAVTIEAGAFELPSQMNVGVAYSRPLGDAAVVTLLGQFKSNSFTQDEFSGALEVGLMNLLYARGGYTVMEQDQDFTFYKGLNLGAGLNLELDNTRKLQVDYAYRATDFFDNINMFTVGVTL